VTLVGRAAEAERLAPVVGCKTANWPQLSGAAVQHLAKPVWLPI